MLGTQIAISLLLNQLSNEVAIDSIVSGWLEQSKCLQLVCAPNYSHFPSFLLILSLVKLEIFLGEKKFSTLHSNGFLEYLKLITIRRNWMLK